MADKIIDGSLEISGQTTANGLVVKNSTGQTATFTVTNPYEQVGSLSLSGVDYLSASNIQATFYLVNCSAAYITQLGNSDTHIYTYLDQNFTFKTNESGESGRGQATYGVKIPNTYGWTADRTLATTNDIPTVNNGTLTIQKNGTNIQTFTANQSGNATANITVPTTLDDISDGSTRKLSNYLSKISYEWNKAISFGSSGYLLIGKFPMYDTNITIDIDSTTSTTYHATLVIATQNINNSHGGTYVANVYGDANNTVTGSFKIQYSNGSRNFNIYFAPEPWSKNLIHIRAVALKSAPTESEICTNVDSIPTTDLITVTNQLSSNYLGKTAKAADADKLDGNDSTYYLNYNNLTNKPTIPTVNNATLTIQKNGTTVNSFTANASSNVTANITVPTKTSDITNDSGFLTSHQSIKTLKTDNTTAQSTSSSEAIAGSGTINLHKVAKTGTYSDLIGTPTIPTTYLASASVSSNTLTLTPASGTATTFTPYNQTVAANGTLFPVNREVNFVGKDGITVAADSSIANQINISGSYPTPEIIDISGGLTQAIKNKVTAKPLSFLQDSNGYLYYPSYSSDIPNYYESFDTESCESKMLSIDWTNLTVDTSSVYYAEVADVQNKTYIHNLTITPTSTTQAKTLYLKLINRTSTSLTKANLLSLSNSNSIQPRTVDCGILNVSNNFYPARLVSTSYSGSAPTFTILVNGQSSNWTLTLSTVTDTVVQL